MILIDYNPVAIANIAIAIKKDGEELNKKLVLHMTLNSIRRYIKEFKKSFSTPVICYDSKNNWRKTFFPYYKIRRKKDRKDSSIDWDFVYENLEYIKSVFEDGFFNIITIEEDYCEADDVIGVLSRYATSKKEKSIIISNDKDFIQLHNDYIWQYRPVSDSSFCLKEEASKYLKEQIIKGDRDDGVPNIKSQDDIFVLEGKRQKPIYKKELDKWLVDDNLLFLETDELRQRYIRNRKLVDLSFTPEHHKINIIKKYKDQKELVKPNRLQMMDFFIKNKLNYLMVNINDFF